MFFESCLQASLRIFPSSRAYMEATVRRVTSRTSLGSVLRQQTAFEGGGSLEFFSKSQGLYRGGGIGIFQVPEPRRKLGFGIFQSPSA